MPASNKTNPHLQQFAQQLAAWTADVIERGRTPFRRVETYPEIITAIGPVRIPLVFWINRQSMMTGGLLLLPEENLEEELERGTHCAQALGLKYFVTWEKNQVRIWKIQGKGIVEHQIFPLANPDHLETFHFTLEDLLEALKLTVVLDPIPVSELSTSYFINLYRITLQKTLPSIIDAYRSHRSENDDNQTMDIDTCAQEVNRLTLLQILTLLWFQKMPETMLPEKLDKALELSLPLLPEKLHQNLTLRTIPSPPELPSKAAVAFHHFLLRLRQLSWEKNPDRIKKSITELASSWFPKQLQKNSACGCYLHPSSPFLGTNPSFILSESSSLLALAAILLHISGEQKTTLIFGHTISLNQQVLPNAPLEARLLNTRPVTTQERSGFLTQLRSSWPHRRFKIKTGQPIWLWEFTHLLGLSQPYQKLLVEIPRTGLQTHLNGPAWDLFSEFFRLEEIRPTDESVILKLSRQDQADISVSVHYAENVREVGVSGHRNQFRSHLLLALSLPADIFRLVGEELIWPDMQNTPELNQKGMEIYKESLLYQWMKNIIVPQNLSATEPFEPGDKEDPYIPLPQARVLNQLSDAEKSLNDKMVTVSTDHLLADILFCPALTTIEIEDKEEASKTEAYKPKIKKHFREYIGRQALHFGVPNFPEQYLYFLDQPEIRNYEFSPPLTVKSRVLGQFVLEDFDGQTIEGYGEELEQALILCAQAGKDKVALPRDREQINVLLHHYRKDLNALYEHIKHLCFGQVENAKEAQKTLRKVWKKLLLPDPSWFKN